MLCLVHLYFESYFSRLSFLLLTYLAILVMKKIKHSPACFYTSRDETNLRRMPIKANATLRTFFLLLRR